MRKRSGANFDEILSKEWSVITKNQYQEIQSLFKKTQQRGGGISLYDMLSIINKTLNVKIDQQLKDKINKQITDKEIRVLDMNVLMNFAAKLKKQNQEDRGPAANESNQYLDAFVALGGQPDRSGFVSKKTLIQTIKTQFELTFDIESMIDNVQGSSIDYSSFCEIFQQDRQKGDGSLAQAASTRSLGSSESMRSLVISQKDFEKFVAQYESDEMYS